MSRVDSRKRGPNDDDGHIHDVTRTSAVDYCLVATVVPWLLLLLFLVLVESAFLDEGVKGRGWNSVAPVLNLVFVNPTISI